jgi:hypothetical protein
MLAREEYTALMNKMKYIIKLTAAVRSKSIILSSQKSVMEAVL